MKAAKRKQPDNSNGSGSSTKHAKTRTEVAGEAAPAGPAGAGGAASQAQALAAQIKVKEKLLKLLKKQQAHENPGERARLQHKIDKCLGKAAAGAGAPAAAAAAAGAPAGGSRAAALAGAAAKPAAGAAQRHKQPQAQQKPQKLQLQRQPLAGIAPVLALTPAEQARRAERQQRFASDLASLKAASSAAPAGPAAGGGKAGVRGSRPGGRAAAAWGGGQAAEAEGGIGSGWLALEGGFGTNQALEKEFLRLTSVPKAEDVRPPEVLAQSLALVKARWRGGCAYAWACSQLKSIRQDLTVQGVANELTRDAYETHARVALEAADLPEFRQCLSRLRQLYRSGVASQNEPEFYSYGLLHAAALGPLQLTHELSRLPRDLLSHSALRHALDTVGALRRGNYAAFMRLYGSAPRMAPYLMDHLLERVRMAGLGTLLTAYHPCRLPFDWAAAQLGFGDDQADEALAFFEAAGAVVDAASRELDTKASRAAAAARTGTA